MRSTTTKAFAGVAVLALALAGCGSNSGSSTKSADSNAKLSYSINEQAATNLKDGGNLNLSIEEITPQLNMFQANMTVDTSTLWNWYNPQLIKFTPSGDMKLDKNYLESVNSELKDGKTVRDYYYHSVSHSLGLDCHDVTTPSCKTLRPGMVITVEPGLYIEEEGIGIRIENDIVITEEKPIDLSSNILKTVEDIEAFMAGNKQ